MKKVYQKPTMTVVKVQAAGMLMQSVNATMVHVWDQETI